MGKYKSCLVFIIGFCILCLVVQFDKKNAPGGREYNNFKDACEALDFQAAYNLAGEGIDEYPEEYWHGSRDNFDYVFNAEITYLCGLKTKEADDRIIHVLLELPSHGDAVDENVKYSGTPYYRANMYKKLFWKEIKRLLLKFYGYIRKISKFLETQKRMMRK